MVLWHNCKSLGKIQRRGQKESRKLKRRNHYRPLVRVIYIIDRRCSPPLITAGIQMISPKIESRRGQSSRQTKERDKQKMYTVKKIASKRTVLKKTEWLEMVQKRHKSQRKEEERRQRTEKYTVQVHSQCCYLLASISQDQRQSGHTHHIILTCSLSPLCTRGQTPLVTGQHWPGPAWSSAGAS